MNETFVPYGIVNYSQGKTPEVLVRGSNKWVQKRKPTATDAKKVMAGLRTLTRTHDGWRRLWAKNPDMVKKYGGSSTLRMGTLEALGVNKRSSRFPVGKYVKIYGDYNYAPIYDMDMFNKYDEELRIAYGCLNKGKGKRKDYDGAIQALVKAHEYLDKSVKPCDVCRYPNGMQKATKKGHVKSCENCAGYGKYGTGGTGSGAFITPYKEDREPYYIYPHNLRGKPTLQSDPCWQRTMRGKGDRGSTPNCPICGLKGFRIDPSKYSQPSKTNWSYRPCSVCEGEGGEKCVKCESSGWHTKESER